MSSHREIEKWLSRKCAWLLVAWWGACGSQTADHAAGASSPQCAGAQTADGRASCDSAEANSGSAARTSAAGGGKSAAGVAADSGTAAAGVGAQRESAASAAGDGACENIEVQHGSAGAAAASGACENVGAPCGSAGAAASGGTCGNMGARSSSAAAAAGSGTEAVRGTQRGSAGAAAHSGGACKSSGVSMPSTPTGSQVGSAGSSGRAGSGGMEGAAASSSASTSAASGCGAQGFIFCDDFESNAAEGMPPAAPWTIANNGMGHSSIDTQTPAHSGKASVKVTSEGGYQTFFALTSSPVFPHEGALYLRLYIRLDAPMTGGHNTYYKAGAAGAASSDHETRVGVMNGMLMINQPAGDRGFLSNEDYYRDGNMPGVVFAPMTWVCVETFFDPANKTIDVWVDGSEVPDLHRTDWEQDPIGALHFGFEKYAGPDATIWYDDIALSTQPIGCR